MLPSLGRLIFFVIAALIGGIFVIEASGWFLGETLGSDYTYFLPKLLFGYFWFHENGITEVPWFSPAACAGLPFFANPQSGYYSIPQLITMVVDPQSSIYLTFVIFGLTGAAAMYALLRVSFQLSTWFALLGAVLFLFNEFYLSRMLAGHLTYHMFPLIPLITLLSIQSTVTSVAIRHRVLLTTMNGFLIAYFVHGGAANFVVPAMLSVVCLLMIYCAKKQRSFVDTMKWFLTAGLLGFLLSAAKIIAAYSYMRWFPRDSLHLGLFDNFQTSIFSAFTMLFMNPWLVMSELEGQYLVQQHELQFGVTLVPLLLLLMGAPKLVMSYKSITLSRRLLISGLLIIMSLPVVLSVRSEIWNEFLKTIPYLNNTSLVLRWLALDIPVIIVGTLVLGQSALGARMSAVFSVVGIIIVVFSHLLPDRPIDNSYTPAVIAAGYQRVRESDTVPPITIVTSSAGAATFLGLGDQLTTGATGDICYEPIFGYRLENYPRKQLHVGQVTEQVFGSFNLKNPACYVYPVENNCSAGDHFSIEQGDLVNRFVRYKPFAHTQSKSQVVANWVSKLTLALMLIGLCICPFLKGKLRPLGPKPSAGGRS